MLRILFFNLRNEAGLHRYSHTQKYMHVYSRIQRVCQVLGHPGVHLVKALDKNPELPGREGHTRQEGQATGCRRGCSEGLTERASQRVRGHSVCTSQRFADALMPLDFITRATFLPKMCPGKQ